MSSRPTHPPHLGDRAPSVTDPVVSSASHVAGGPLGRYAVPSARGWRTIGAWLVAASALPMALGVWQRGYCIEGGWRTPDQFFHMCFSDLPATFASADLGAGVGAFLAGGAGAPTPAQPPLTALVLTATGGLIPFGSPDDQARWFFGIWAVLAAVLVALLTWWTAGSLRRIPLRASHVALSPVVALTTLVAPDVLGVALAAAGLYAWSRSRVGWAGALLGLAIAARSYPLLLVLAVLFVAARAGRTRSALRMAGIAVVTALAVYAVVAVRNPSGAIAALTAWRDAGAGLGSPWVLPLLAGSALPPVAVTALAVAGWVLAILAGATFALSARRRPAIAEVALVMVVIVLVTGASFPVQASLWLVPLVALVGLPWRDHLWWAGAEALHFGAVWLYLASDSVADRGLPAGWYALALLTRLVAVCWLGYAAWRRAVRRHPDVTQDERGVQADPSTDPETDHEGETDPFVAADRWPARQADALLDPEALTESDGEVDPLAGPLAGAADSLVVRFR